MGHEKNGDIRLLLYELLCHLALGRLVVSNRDASEGSRQVPVFRRAETFIVRIASYGTNWHDADHIQAYLRYYGFYGVHYLELC